MGHDEEESKDPEYWNRVHNILGPLILDILGKDVLHSDKNKTDIIKLEEIVSIS